MACQRPSLNSPLLAYAAYDICFKLIGATTNHLDIKTTIVTIVVVFQPLGFFLLISGQPVACHDLTKWKRNPENGTILTSSPLG